LDVTGSGCGIVEGFCGQDDEPCNTLNCIVYLNQLGKYHWLKTGSEECQKEKQLKQNNQENAQK